MDDIIVQTLFTLLLVLMPLFRPGVRRNGRPDDSVTRIHSVYGVNEDGKLELLKNEDKDA